MDEASGHLAGAWGGAKEVDFFMGDSGAPAGRRRSWQGSLTRPAGTPPASPTAARPQASPDHPSAAPPPRPPIPKLHRKPSGDLARLRRTLPPLLPPRRWQGGAGRGFGSGGCTSVPGKELRAEAHRPLTQPSTSSSRAPFARARETEGLPVGREGEGAPRPRPRGLVAGGAARRGRRPRRRSCAARARAGSAKRAAAWLQARPTREGARSRDIWSIRTAGMTRMDGLA